MEIKDMIQTDEQFRQFFGTSKLRVDKNLKYRIMHQIETEALFTQSVRKKEKKMRSQINQWLTILGVFYASIITISILFFSVFGQQFYQMTEYYYIILFIGVISTTFGLINFLDEKRRKNRLQ